VKLNPTALLPNQYAAWMHFHMGEHARAEAQARWTMEMFPDALQPHFVLGWAAWYQGRAEEAVAVFEKALGENDAAAGSRWSTVRRESAARRFKPFIPSFVLALLGAGMQRAGRTPSSSRG
jgi:tetratricopeptide (TPR) repeat protein